MRFTDRAEPVSHLTSPSQPSEWKDPLNYLNDFGNLFSPTAWANEIYEMAFGFNPLERAQEYLAGDWEAYAKCSEVWANIGSLCSGLGGNIASGNVSLDRSWEGNAADAAFVYFKSLARRCEDLESDLTSLKTQYMNISHAVWAAAQTVGSLLSQIADAAAVAAVSAMAGNLIAWTGWGAAVGYGVAAVEIIRIIDLWGDLTASINTAQTVAQTALAVIGAAGAGISMKFSNFPLPGGSYSHPSA